MRLLTEIQTMQNSMEKEELQKCKYQVKVLPYNSKSKTTTRAPDKVRETAF